MTARMCRIFVVTVFPFLLCAAVINAACSRPAKSAEPRPQPPPFEYAGEWGTHGSGPGQLDIPAGIAVDGDSNVYIADAGSGYVHKFSLAGEPRLSFQDDRVNLHPTEIAVDSGGAIYVPDGQRGSVFIYFPDGTHYRELRTGVGSSARNSLCVGVDAAGNIFVAAKRPFGVHQFSPRLRPLASWAGGQGKESNTDNPAALGVGPDGLVYVSMGVSIKVFNTSGELQRTLSLPSEAGDARFSGIAVNGKYVVAAEIPRPVVHVWTLDGAYRLQEDLSAWIPAAIAGGPAPARKVALTPAGELLVLDPPHARVLRFRLHL
jgi:hypothetical protein